MRPYWTVPADDLLATLETRAAGLTSAAAARRLKEVGGNVVAPARASAWLPLLLSRFANPLVVILVVAAVVSMIVREWVDAVIVLAILAMTAVLSFVQEYRAAVAVETLRKRVSVTARVMRDGTLQSLPASELVPGDVVALSAGDLVPADARVLDARDCFVNQALVTGESLPVEKHAGTCDGGEALADRTNTVFMGTSLRSGTARVVLVDTGRNTVFGAIAERLTLHPPATEFERGLKRFGSLLLGLMLTVVVVVLAVNILLQRPTIETLLFAAALAVGLSPELLPAILAITLSHGAQAMAREGVIVKRLDAIESLGSMDTLCMDKTGTLTKGVIALDAAVDPQGAPSPAVLRRAVLNARLQTGIRNPLDEAIAARGDHDGVAIADARKRDEIPYDFQRRRLGVVVADGEAAQPLLIVKGAVENVLAACTTVSDGDHAVPLDAATTERLTQRFVDWSNQGFRVLALATRTMEARPRYGRDDERDMTFAGFLLFFDPPEPQATTTLDALRALGVGVKIITGDNRYVARHVADTIGARVEGVLTGAELHDLSDEALWQRAPGTTLFAEIEPSQKERIIRALQRRGHVVGFLGDGINDAPALYAADVGLSVDTAVDVAKDAADFVLLRHDLDVLRRGIEEGRRTFANTLKYVIITTSANFGNMISMALASLYLPFLPLLATQILLNNFLSDIPAMGIAGDAVDDAWKRTPHRWDIRWIARSMLTFGLTSTVFDLLTFWILLRMAHGDPAMFRTGWFVESLWTELAILLVLRTVAPFWRSRPGPFLRWSVPVVAAVALALPFLPIGRAFAFIPMPPAILGAILGVTLVYAAVSEASKRLFFGRFGNGPGDAR